MLTPKQYQELKTKIDGFQSRVSRLQGQREEIERTLAAEFEVTTIEEAKALLTEIQTKYERAVQRFETSYEQFNDKYASIL